MKKIRPFKFHTGLTLLWVLLGYKQSPEGFLKCRGAGIINLGIMSLVLKLRNYLQETKVELKKVSWPTRKEIFRCVVGVIIFSGAVALVLGMFDFGFLELVRRLFV